MIRGQGIEQPESFLLFENNGGQVHSSKIWKIISHVYLLLQTMWELDQYTVSLAS